MQHNPSILVLDFGSQYTQLIARRLREYGVYTEIVPYFEKLDSIKAKNPRGIILSGGPASVYEKDAYKPNFGLFSLGVPVLGICYGMQLIAQHFGGRVMRAEAQEFGKAVLEIEDKNNKLFKGVKQDSIVWMSHADKVESIPQGFVELAKSGNTHYCAIADYKCKIYALQFHPEVVHSECGAQILQNFAVDICESKTNWNMHNFAQNIIMEVRQKVLGSENAPLKEAERAAKPLQEMQESIQEKPLLHFIFTQADKKDFKLLHIKPTQNTIAYKCTLQGKMVAFMCGYRDKNIGLIKHFMIDIADKHQAQGIKNTLLQHLCTALQCETLHIKDSDLAFYDEFGVPYTQKEGFLALSLSDVLPPPVIITKRLILREYTESDFANLHKILSDDAVMHSWGGGFNAPQSKEWLKMQLKHYRKFGFGMWAVVEKKSREIIGHIGLNTMGISLDSKNLSIVELGYLLRTVSQKQGYGIEAARACADYAFYQLGIDILYCLITEGHTDSINLAKKFNMTLLGVNGKEKYKTELVYGINKQDWLYLRNVKVSNNVAISPIDTIQTRCEWVKAKNAEDERLYQDYHDCEWGVPLHEDKKLFEFLILEGFQAGLSWITILKKREHFRVAFDDFDPHIVANYDEDKIKELMRNEGIIRNRAKIEAGISNAKAFLAVQREFGSFDKYIWGFVNHKPIINTFESIADLPASTPLSDKIAKDLKKRGFKFVGTTTMYAMMQSIGMVNDHLTSCFKRNSSLGMQCDKILDFSQGTDTKSANLKKNPKNLHSHTANTRIVECQDSKHILAQKPTPSKVLCAVSGGVDSSVVAALLYRAIGENLIPVFVDTGLLRKGEREAVEKMFRENLKVPLITADASELFLSRLKGVLDPEIKRKIIGETFIEVFEKEAKKHNTKGEIKFLAQGTLYPDVIESVSVKGPSKTIKSHHNVGGLPEWMKFELIEPLRELFKDEVRALGRELGMPESMLMRHPFPGPGLAIRIMGEVNKADLNLLREADSIFIEELHKQGYYDKVWQAFCVLLNVRSVGVMGDNRTYDNTICVRAVEAIDGMTATFAHLPHDFLEGVSNRIINEVEGINRVVYDITSKPPGTIEWE